MERLAHTHSDDRSELLSAYSDNTVDVVERRRVEQYLDECRACAQELRELRMFKELLGDLPKLQPPRSFTLDPHAAPRPRWLLFPTLRLASVMATLLLFVVLGVDGLGSMGGTSAPTSATSAQMERRSMEQAPEAAVQSQAEAGAGTAGGTTAGAGAAGETTAGADAGGGTGGAPAAAFAPMPPEASAQAAAAAAAPPAQADAAGGATAMGGAADAPAEGNVEGGNDDQQALKGEDTAGAETVTLDQDATAANNATPSPFDTLLLVELALGLAALAFGVGAFIAWRRGI